jgi:hypothetical protein
MELDTGLDNHCFQAEKRFFGFHWNDIRQTAFQLSKRNSIPNPFSFENERAEKTFLRGFLKRNVRLTMRTPQHVSTGRIKSFNHQNANKSFDMLGPKMYNVQFSPNNIVY